MLDYQIFGLNPHGYRLINILFHVFNTILLFLIFHRMTRALWQSAFVACLFAVHPLHVESIAWVTERKDVLSTFFWMLTMGAYIHYVERPGLRRYLPVLLFFVLGLMAKPMLVTLPFVLLLLDYWPLHRFQEIKTDHTFHWSLIRPLLWEKVPLFALAAISSIVTYIVMQKGVGAGSFGVFPLNVRIANAFVSYVIYIEKMIWPSNLAVFYPHPGVLPLWQVLGSVLLLMAVTLTIIWMAKRFSYLATGWFWYIGTLVPVIGLVQNGSYARADRYTYIPLIGLLIMAAWGVPELLKKWRFQKEVLFALSTVTILCFLIVTWTQIGYWQNSITLFDHTLKVTDHNSFVHDNRGIAYGNLGNYGQAINDFDRAIELNPKYAEAYHNRGVAYYHLGNFKQAISDFDKAIKINPNYAQVYHDRGAAYGNLGNYGQAINDFDRAIELNPKYAEAYNNRGNAYKLFGNQKQAISDYDKAIDISPNFAEAYYNRGIIYSRLGNQRQAIEDLRTAARFGQKNAQDILISQGIIW
jgi:Flp pilus assembly protein TadD